MFILLHWYRDGGFGCGKMITYILKLFNIFSDVYTCDGTISVCQRDASAQIVMRHNYRTQDFESIPFTSSVVTKWHDRHRYLSIHHVPYLMSLSGPRHCSTTLKQHGNDQSNSYIISEVTVFSAGSHYNHVTERLEYIDTSYTSVDNCATLESPFFSSKRIIFMMILGSQCVTVPSM